MFQSSYWHFQQNCLQCRWEACCTYCTLLRIIYLLDTPVFSSLTEKCFPRLGKYFCPRCLNNFAIAHDKQQIAWVIGAEHFIFFTTKARNTKCGDVVLVYKLSKSVRKNHIPLHRLHRLQPRLWELQLGGADRQVATAKKSPKVQQVNRWVTLGSVLEATVILGLKAFQCVVWNFKTAHKIRLM